MDAIILSAGEGTRLRPLTLHTPKALIPVKCKPLIEHILKNLQECGIYCAAINTFYRSRDIVNYFESREKVVIEPHIVLESNILGTGGGISNTATYLDGDNPILVHNGDIYCEFDFRLAIIEHRKSDAMITLLVRDGNREVEVIDNQVVNIANRLSINGDSSYKFTGISIWEREALRFLPKPGDSGNMIDGLVDILNVMPGSVRVFHIGEALWCDIGTISSYIELHAKLLKDNIFPPDLALPSGVTTTGFLCCCEGTRIESGTSLHNVIIWQDSIVSAGSQLKNAVVGPFGIVRL